VVGHPRSVGPGRHGPVRTHGASSFDESAPRPSRRGRAWPGLVGAACAVLLLPALATGVLAGTTGKLSGRVLDPAKKPLTGANVILVGAPYGAATDAEGRFSILNVPPGRYDVKASMLGYRTVLTQGVVISADHTTPLDATLIESPVELAQVVVTAKRPVIDVGQTSNIATVSREEIRNLPVQELQDVVNLQAGVVDGHVRGGRIGEVQYQVDGVSVNNAYDNKSTLRLDRSLLEEVQVISGTFDAEYGQAMSGVVNAVLRRGTEKFTWQAEAFTGGYLYSGDARIQTFDAHPAALQNYQLNLSGPFIAPKTLYLVSARRFTSEDWIQAARIFNPSDRRDTLGGYHPSGDGKFMPLGFNREWSGLGKISTRLLPGVELTYQAIVNLIDGRRGDFAFRFNPDGLPSQRTRSAVHGFDWTHTLNKATYYKLYARQNYLDYRDMAYPDLYDRRYDRAGQPEGNPDVQNGAYTQGVSLTRFLQRTNNPVVGGSYVSQVSRDHLMKTGLDFQFPYLVFGNPGHLVFVQEGGTETLLRYQNRPPDFPGLHVYKPRMASGFAQDEIEMDDLRIRAGVRVEYFAARATVPSDLANPANAIAGAPLSTPKLATKKISVMPRIGVSYPLTTKASVFFAYGQFTQMPPLGDIFTNADYSKLAQIQASGIDYGVLGNPDIRPERTVQYQFGYKQALSDQTGLDFNVFYKDIRDLLGVEFISTYNDAEYARLTNADFGNVLGFTVTLDQRALGPVSATVDYTWQRAQGNSSDPRETATRAAAGESPRPRVVPLNWDQRQTLNVTVTAARPDRYSTSLIVRGASGQPYTPSIASGFGGGLESNSGRKPGALLADVRGEMTTMVAKRRVSVFGRIFNLFDTRFFNGFVFSSSGSPYYSVYSPADVAQLSNPSRFYAPRRVEVGLTLQGGAQ
jgi:outer membrane receptor protein involved in Fe transport